MIYVTQGHEKGIGLEVFLKSFLMLSEVQKNQIRLIVSKKDFEQNLKDLNLRQENLQNLNLIYTNDESLPSSTSSLLLALKSMTERDLLITLPTSKDQLIYENKLCAGYTEFFRAYYKNSHISMTFVAPHDNVLLITDHLSIKDISNTITEKLIVEKTKFSLDFFKKYFYPIDEVIFSGINPHCGENGILGDEDQIISLAINKLRKQYKIKIAGPFSGDTLHMHHRDDKKQLMVYMFHDQGLAPFKSKNGLIGLNVTMGLPFLRLSVDHGTAFELYGKNHANFIGMTYLLKEAFKVVNYVN